MEENTFTSIYNVDNELFGLLTESSFNATVNMEKAVKRFASYNMKSEKQSDVQGRLYTKDSAALTALPRGNVFLTEDGTDNAFAFDVFYEISYHNSDIEKGWVQKLFSTFPGGLDPNSNNYDKEYYRFLKTTVSGPLIEKLINVFDQFPRKHALEPNFNSHYGPDNRQAQNDIHGVVNSNKRQLIDGLIEATEKAMIKLVVEDAAEYQPDIVRDFNPGNNKRPLYYRLKYELYESWVVPKLMFGALGDNYLLWVKKMIVDMFLKLCYPLVQFFYVNALYEKFKQHGDFVNANVAYIALGYFVLYYLSAWYDRVGVNYNLETKFNDAITQIRIFINEINNKMSEPEKIKDIVKSLKEKSGKVVKNTEDLEDIKVGIEKNQLALRNIVANVATQEKKYNRSILVFKLTFVMLFLYVALCSGLLLANMQSVINLLVLLILLIFIIKSAIKYLYK